MIGKIKEMQYLYQFCMSNLSGKSKILPIEIFRKAKVDKCVDSHNK